MTNTYSKIHSAELGGDESEALKAVAKLCQHVDKTTLMTDPGFAEVLLEIKASVGNERGRQHWESDFLKCKDIVMKCIENTVSGESEVALGALVSLIAGARKMKKNLFQGTCWFCFADCNAKQGALNVLYGTILPICEGRSWFDKQVELPKDSEALLKAANDASSADLSLISDDSQRSSFREFAVKLARKLDEEAAKMVASTLERLASVVTSLKDCVFVFVCSVL
jgi:hypothetical protein